MNAVKKILIVFMVFIGMTGCTKEAMTRHYIHKATLGTHGLTYGSDQWIRYMETLCPDVNWQDKECQDAKQLKGEHDRDAYYAGKRTPEQLEEQKREWDNVQKWFGFYNQVEGMNRALGNPSYDPQQKGQNRQQDARRGKCLAQCNAGSSGSTRAYQNCQAYCNSMFPEL